VLLYVYKRRLRGVAEAAPSWVTEEILSTSERVGWVTEEILSTSERVGDRRAVVRRVVHQRLRSR